jgi:hypothetical protein
MASTQQVVVVTTAASSTPVSGSAANGAAPSAMFTPQLGRDMYLSLSGGWTGTVRIQRSTDNGSTWNNITIGGGQPWGVYTGACDEVVETPTDGASKYRLLFTISTGTVTYRLAQ